MEQKNPGTKAGISIQMNWNSVTSLISPHVLFAVADRFFDPVCFQ